MIVRIVMNLLVLMVIGPELAASSAAERIETAKQFRRLVANEEWDEARALMSSEPRRWFEEQEGEGRPWTVGPSGGPWSAWDEEFDSSSTVIEWKAGERSATARVLEINDYFRLLERGAVTNEITYFYDHEGRIDGLLIRAVGERPPGRTNEFLRWALENEPEELRELMPNGRIDPSGDHPQRFRALLERWRDDVGLPALSSSRGSAVSEEDSRTVEGVEPALRRLSERFVRGWRENDPEAVMSTLATNAVILPHHGVHPKEGMEEIRAFWFPEDGPAARVVKFGQTYDEIAGTEEIAYARGRFELSFEWNGTIYSNEGNYLMLFGRGEDGEWKITHRIWNDPIPEER